jgi:hypothetical protein
VGVRFVENKWWRFTCVKYVCTLICAARRLYATIIGENEMLWTIAVILIVLWVLGLVSSYTIGGFIHILLVVAIVIVVLNLVQGRRGL